MWQLFDKIRPRLKEPAQEYPLAGGKNTPAGAAATDWGNYVWGYVTNLYGTSWNSQRQDKANKEIEDRGLSFGQVRVQRGNARSVKLSLLGNQKVTLEQAEQALKTALQEKWIDTKVEVRLDVDWGNLKALSLSDDLSGINVCSVHNGESVNYKEFLTIECWPGGGGLREMAAHSPEATCVLTRVAEILGFPAGPKHYAHESPVKIEDIVVFAARWEDPRSGSRYLDVLLRKVFVKHQIWHGSNHADKYTEGEYSGEVLACKANGNWWPKMTVNNRPVYATIVSEPTRHMLKAREKFIKESLTVCGYCGKPATRRFNHVRVDMGDMTIGGIGYTCDEEGCVSKAKEVKSVVRTTESPYTPDIWS